MGTDPALVEPAAAHRGFKKILQAIHTNIFISVVPQDCGGF